MMISSLRASRWLSRACGRRQESLSLSTAATTAASSSLYMWGANIKGTIPGVERSHVDVPTEIHWRNVLSGESANELDE